VPVLAVNKCESQNKVQFKPPSFGRWDWVNPFLSGIHGSSTGELLDKLITYLPQSESLPETNWSRYRRTPNVGKSSLLNAFVGNSGVVSPISGTTVTIDTVIERQGQITD